MSGHNSQRRQPEDLVAVLVYIMVSAEAQWRHTERVFARRRLQGKQIFDALNSDDGVDTIRVHRKSLDIIVGSCVHRPG